LLSVAFFVAGLALGCIAELRTSAWMVERVGKPDEYILEDAIWNRWSASVSLDVKLIQWAMVLIPLGAGGLLGSFAGLAWMTKGRFRLRSLLIGMTSLCLVFGFLFGIVRPRLQNPRFVYRPELGDVAFEQHGEPASESGFPVLNRQVALIVAAPLLILPLLLFVPPRIRPPALPN
jgi:hypothetical protein